MPNGLILDPMGTLSIGFQLTQWGDVTVRWCGSGGAGIELQSCAGGAGSAPWCGVTSGRRRWVQGGGGPPGRRRGVEGAPQHPVNLASSENPLGTI